FPTMSSTWFEMDQVNQAMRQATSSQSLRTGEFSLQSWFTPHNDRRVSGAFRAKDVFGCLRRHCKGQFEGGVQETSEFPGMPGDIQRQRQFPHSFFQVLQGDLLERPQAGDPEGILYRPRKPNV